MYSSDKKVKSEFLFSIVAVLWLALSATAETWTLENPRAWAREKDAVKVAQLPDGVLEVRHTGAADWCVNGFPLIEVKRGDTFELSCETEALADVQDSNPVKLSAVLRDEAGKEISWSFGTAEAKPGSPVKTAFMVPRGVATIQPRLLGNGTFGARVRNVRATRTGNEMPRPVTALATTFENEQLLGNVGGAGFEVTDKRTGRTWRPVGNRSFEVEEIARAVEDDGTVRMTYVHPESLAHWNATYKVEKDRPEVAVAITGEGPMAKPIPYPAAFATENGDRLIVPMNEGIGYPADEPDDIPRRLIAYGGHGICMAFFGVQDDATGAGWMAILETPDDAAMVAKRDAETKRWTLGPSWEGQKKQFGYVRRIRYVFLDKGGYVAMCKRYRAYAKEIGKLKTFTEKAKERPLVDRLLGAANVWCWGDYNNKLPSIWWKRDLFNVLYGTMGMYLFNNRQWAEDKERFVRSYRITSPVARATGYSEMTDHRVLSSDRKVQASRFSDGTVVVVNFGDEPFCLPGGETLPARGHCVRLGRHSKDIEDE